MHTNDGREPAARHHAKAAAHHLYADHQRERKQRGPERAVAETRSGNGIGRNASTEKTDQVLKRGHRGQRKES